MTLEEHVSISLVEILKTLHVASEEIAASKQRIAHLEKVVSDLQEYLK